jgi:hypothetical protein
MNYQWIETRTGTPIVELRRYTLHPGRRDALIELFEQKFVEPQEAVGATVLGTFRVEGADDSFIWLRGFPDMPARKAALEGFYGGPEWRANREAANATMIDSDDVHLLRAITPAAGLPLAGLRHPPLGTEWPARHFGLMISELRYPEFVGNYHLWLRLFLRKAGADPLASFATLPAENNFPALPVWKNRHVHVALLPEPACLPALPAELGGLLRRPPEMLALNPTARSLLR